VEPDAVKAIRALHWIRAARGAGLGALAVFAGTLAFLVLALQPLQARNAQLPRELARLERPPSTEIAPAQQLAVFYDYLQTEQPATGWLARLHASARLAGLELRTGDYRMKDAGQRMARYEIALPVVGSYPQIRDFLSNALYEIPVLSLDQVTFSRQRASDARVQADVRFTLYLLKP
jgi:hypothetical protein